MQTTPVIDTDTSLPTSAENRMTLTVAARTVVADAVVELTLTHPAGWPLPRWAPGAHLDLVLGPNLVRQYSLCGDPGDRTAYRVAVLREPDSRGGSLAVHDNLTVGATIEVQGPRNNFALVDAQEYLFIAGGIGITPLIPMIATAEAQGIPFRLVYGGRARSSMAYVEDLENRYPGRVTIHPQDEVGHLDLPAILGKHRPGRRVFTCGPGPLLDAIDGHCLSWPAGSVNMERFRAKTSDPATVDTEFEVELALTGVTVSVPADRSILDVVEEAGAIVVSSCREGTCGSCETPILEGEADHRDSLLTQDEKDAQETMFICVSRACSRRLVLDL
ncbi:PDR/VanB family oxidoreductase [Rhodococcus sp. IEGM 1307]|uniref:PDR/VanB family oxidoreductase n=1 Tax=Rhodococcus sp. IEGM 1307 TaxID=3047091 RepID=UPI0024B67F4D|nr:PDR/VanB family oxidoreductase [Rhodococcus sp. IEGM 1307]MDI9977176.1 PDR/VanB family oxidoreductase [Rhodococcus sp. IEGM 1307]